MTFENTKDNDIKTFDIFFILNFTSQNIKYLFLLGLILHNFYFMF